MLFKYSDKEESKMFPPAQLMIDQESILDRFTTTYQRDFQPVREIQPWMKTRAGARPAPLLSSSLQAWPTIIKLTYKTTNSTYGLTVFSQENHASTQSKIPPVTPHSPHPPNCVSQHPSRSCPPSFLHPVRTLTPSVPSEDQMLGCTQKEDTGQETGVARETGHSLGEDAEDRRCCLCAENGMVRLADFLRSLHKESKPQQKLSRPASWPLYTQSRDKDAENQESSSCGLNPVLQQQSKTFPPPSSRHCALEDQHHKCTKMQQGRLPPVRSTTQPPFQLQHGFSSWGPPLTEYQTSFGAKWVLPKIHQTDVPSCHRRFHSFKV